MIPRRIVAEVTVNWPKAEGATEENSLSIKFEKVIWHNAQRGFELESWHLSQFSSTDQINPGMVETIVAVFVERSQDIVLGA